jgi:hypothetical protein
MAYFIRIDDPKRFRLDLLEDSKQLIGNLRAAYALLQLRAEKRKLLESLRDEVKEIGLLITELDKLLPEKQLREEAAALERQEALAQKKKGTAKKKASGKKKAEEKKEEPLDDEQRLTSALDAIERKLATLK